MIACFLARMSDKRDWIEIIRKEESEGNNRKHSDSLNGENEVMNKFSYLSSS